MAANGILAEMCHADFDAWKPEVALLPLGSTEVHARHLPFGTDTIDVEAVTRRAVAAANAAGAKVLMAPALPFGVDANLLEFPYTIHLPPSTMMRVVADVIASLKHHGLRKFLLVNGHGGNTSTAQTICRELYGEAFIAMIDFWMITWDVTKKLMESERLGHACEFETSLALAIRPDLVRMDVAEKTETRTHRLPTLERYGGNFSRPWERYTRNGGIGDPTRATAGKGEAIIAATVERFAELLVELSTTPMDETFPY